jgi:hypothetical protein
MEDHSQTTTRHLPYLPRLAPSDFFLFDYAKAAAHKKECQGAGELLSAVV